MPDNEETNVMTLDIATVPTINDLFQRLKETDVFNIVDTVTFDTHSQTIIFHLQRLLGQRADEIDRTHSGDYDLDDGKIRILSEIYKHKYPQLLTYFKEWKPLRVKLLKLLKSSADNLERNSSFVSGFRIFTSATDILGTIMRYQGSSEYSVANSLMENASVCGLLALFVETVMSRKIHKDVKDAINKDQRCFDKIAQWFKQTEELDKAITGFFPYGIDKDVVKKIHASSDNFQDYQKIFIAIVTSNVKQNVKLFKNRKFLNTAERFATSEAGKLWFHQVILENDYHAFHSLNSTLCDEIQSLLKVSSTGNREMQMNVGRVLSGTVTMKVILNSIIIISAASNLWLGDKPQESDVFEKLLKNSEEELDKIQNIVRLLNPSGSQIDPILRE